MTYIAVNHLSQMLTTLISSSELIISRQIKNNSEQIILNSYLVERKIHELFQIE